MGSKKLRKSNDICALEPSITMKMIMQRPSFDCLGFCRDHMHDFSLNYFAKQLRRVWLRLRVANEPARLGSARSGSLGSARYLNEPESQLGSARYELELAR
jgi:hypothetical protein